MKYYILIALTLIGCSTLPTTGDVPNTPHEKIYSWFPVANQGGYEGVIRGLYPQLIQNGWSSLMTPAPNGFDLAIRLASAKPDGLIVWLPFGHNDTGDFDMAAYTVSASDPRLAKVTDINGFVQGFYELLKKTGIKEIIMYTGYLGADFSQWGGLNADQTKALAYRNLYPYFALAKAIKPLGATMRIVIDALMGNPETGYNFTIAIPLIKEQGIGYGGEAYPVIGYQIPKDPNYMTITDDNLVHFANSNWAQPRSQIKGPIVPFIIDNVQGETPDQRLKRTACSLKTFGNVAVITWETWGSTEVRKLESALTSDCGKTWYPDLVRQ